MNCIRIFILRRKQGVKHAILSLRVKGIHYWGCAGHAIIIVYLADIIRAQGLSLATGALVVGTMFGVRSFTRFAVPLTYPIPRT